MNSSVENGSLVRVAASDVRRNSLLAVRAGAILLGVAFAATLCMFGSVIVSELFEPLVGDLVSWRTYRALTSFIPPLWLILALSAFAVLDALFVSTLLDDGGFSAGVDRMLEHPRSVVPWVLAFWPFRLVVFPHWTMLWLLEGLAVMNGDLSWLPVAAIARAIGVVVLSAPTL